MGVYITNLLRCKPGIAKSEAHGTAGTGGDGLRNVTCIRGHAEADNLGKRTRAAGKGAVEGFEHKHGGPFAKNHATALGREWAAGVFADHSHRLPGLETAKKKRSFAAPGDSQGGGTGADHPEGLPNRMGGRGAGRRNGIGRPFNAVLHTDMARTCVAHAKRNSEGMDPVFAVMEEFPIAAVFDRPPSKAGTGNDCGSFAQVRGPLDARFGDGLAGGDDRELRKAFHEANISRLEVLFGPIFADLRPMLKADLRDVKADDLLNGGSA